MGRAGLVQVGCYLESYQPCPPRFGGVGGGAGGWGEDQALCHQLHDRSGLVPRSWGNWQPLRPPYSLTLCPISVGDGFLRGRVICGAAGSGAHHPGAGKPTSNDTGGGGAHAGCSTEGQARLRLLSLIWLHLRPCRSTCCGRGLLRPSRRAWRRRWRPCPPPPSWCCSR